MSTDSLIKLEGVTKVFLTDEVETHALSGIHMEIKQGEYVSIAGPSGCGKSTLLSILGLLDAPTEGSYTLDGQPVAALTPAERARIRNRKVGFIFQAFNLIGDLTVYENVELPLTYRSMPPEERSERVHRVAVAGALVGDPLILLADEPTGNLDSKNSDSVMDLLRDLHGDGATVCMVTHDPRFTRCAQRTVHLFDGSIVAA